MIRPSYGLPGPIERKIEYGICLWMAALVSMFVVVSFHWPMVGDVTFMHYVVFLMKHGMAPYRDIVDMNLPASYLLEAVAMRLPFPDAVGWRVYDFLLLAVGSVSLLAILRRQGWLTGVVAAALFVLSHGQDGTVMAGERDLAGAVFLLAGVALLVTGLRDGRDSLRRRAMIVGGGVALSFATCVKPTLAPALIIASIWTGWRLRTAPRGLFRAAGLLLAGAAIPVTASAWFLIREGALAAFLREIRGLLPYHATIDERSLGYLCGHAFAPLPALLFLWVVAVCLLRKEATDSERWVLLLMTACGVFSYVVQGKGFSYQRYPVLAFALPLFFTDFGRLLKVRSWRRLVGVAGVVLGVALASQCLFRLTTFQRTSPAQPLLQDLAEFGTPEALSGHVQCMDTIGSCIDNLYAARIVQSTGFLYDCYLLGGQGAAKDAWVTQELRNRFWEQIERNSPQLIVVTDSICYQSAASFDKYEHWPEFQRYLETNYSLVKASGPQVPVHFWSRSGVPFGYRIYERHTDIRPVAASPAR